MNNSSTVQDAVKTVEVATAQLNAEWVEDRCKIVCEGSWTIGAINLVDKQLRSLLEEPFSALSIDTSKVSNLDTAGAWLVERARRISERNGAAFTHIDTNKAHLELVHVIQPDQLPEARSKSLRHRFHPADVLERVGKSTANAGADVLTACYLIGASIRGPQMKPGHRGGIRLTSIVHHIHHMGFKAVPVIALMSFLIGAIIAQQGAYQLRFYGEELLTVNLVGILHFREIGVLLTAVMIAGRSGSAITAEIGTMKMREEIDALKVIGLSPVGVLIFPRLVALIIALPILTLLSDVTGILGAIVVSDIYVGITPQQFITALQAGVEPPHLIVGLIKAPVMAVIIGLAAAVEGLKVGGSAESLGQHTTSAVVRAIFAVIVVDGLFAVFFATIGY